jgi:hypothetical protein
MGLGGWVKGKKATSCKLQVASCKLQGPRGVPRKVRMQVPGVLMADAAVLHVLRYQ